MSSLLHAQSNVEAHATATSKRQSVAVVDIIKLVLRIYKSKGILMLQQGSFIRKKYRKIFFAAAIGSLSSGVNLMIDSLIGGNQLGETALTAISIVAPLFFVAAFFAYLFSPGYCVQYGENNGAFDKETAYKIAGQSIITGVAVAVSAVSLLLVIKEPYLQYYECTGLLYEYASDYYSYLVLFTLIYIIDIAILYLVLADADTQVVSLANIVGILLNIVLSIVLCSVIGVAGLGIATCVGRTGATIVHLLHFLRKTSSIHFIWHFEWQKVKRSIGLSSSIFLSYLFIALVDIIMNKVILISCGISMIAAYSIVNLVYSCYDMYDCVGNSSSGFLSTFLGEKNNNGIKNTLSIAYKTTISIGICFTLLFLFFAPMLPKLYGMTSPDVIEASVRASRWMAVSAIPYGVAFVSVCMYPTFNKPKLGVIITALNDFFCPLILAIPLSFAIGFTGVSIGMALSSYLVLLLFPFIATKLYGKNGFPFYLESYYEEVCSFDLYVNEKSIVEIRDAVKAELDKKGYEIENLELLIEELYKRIYEKNPGKKVMSECTLLFGEDHVRIIVRDDGMVFNFLDENNKVESVNAHVLNSLLEQTKNKEYILTTSFNRNGFVFEK